MVRFTIVPVIPLALSEAMTLALPLPVSVANVQQVFTPDGRCLDLAVESASFGKEWRETFSTALAPGTLRALK